MKWNKMHFSPLVVFRLIIFIVFLVSIYYLEISGQLKLLINPRYDFLIFLSLIILSIFTLFLFATLINAVDRKPDNNTGPDSDKRSHFGYHELFALKNLVFLVLVILLIIFQFDPSDNTYFSEMTKLKGFAISAQSTTSTKGPVAMQNGAGRTDTGENTGLQAGEPVPGAEIVITDDNLLELLSLIHLDLKSYLGQSVTMKGFVFRSIDLDERHFIISRLTMYCCAADAAIAGFICNQGELAYEFASDEWYEIHAVIGKEVFMIENESKSLPVFHIKDYKKIAKLENPYVYPDYNY